MWYIIIVLISAYIVNWVIKNTFSWETVVRSLWKQVYIQADKMAYWVNASINNKESKEDFHKLVENFRNELSVPGNLINAILDWVNKTKNDENTEEETFGYGRYNFDTILSLAKSKPDSYKKLI